MTAANKIFAQELARLSAAFVTELPQQVQTVSDDLGAWLSARRETVLFDRLSHKVHQLKGAGSTFGCNGISDAARVLEQRLAELRSAAASGVASTQDEVDAAMDALRNETNRVYRKSVHRGQPGART